MDKFKFVKNLTFGFTLAEVLITLGIVGVVATMTLHTLISNVQKQILVKQLQKSYSTLNQSFRQMLVSNEADLLSQTDIFNSIGGESATGSQAKQCSYTDDAKGETCKNFYSNLSKYLKIVEIKNFTADDNYQAAWITGTHLSNVTGNVIILADGSFITNYIFYSQDPNNKTNTIMKGMVGDIRVDVNGLKGPNRRGRDIFFFYLGNNGVMYPWGSHEFSIYYSNGKNNNYWETSSKSSSFCRNPIPSSEYGNGCTARVLETGKMDY